MEQLLVNSISLASFCVYFALVLAAITLPIWGYKLFEKKVLNRHQALEVTRSDVAGRRSTMGILASVGTTTSGVFLIQTLPLLFGMIEDIGGTFGTGVEFIFSEEMGDSLNSDNISSFYGMTSQLSNMLQTVAPMAAVGLGGYNLVNNIGRGLPAIAASIFGSKKK